MYTVSSKVDWISWLRHSVAGRRKLLWLLQLVLWPPQHLHQVWLDSPGLETFDYLRPITTKRERRCRPLSVLKKYLVFWRCKVHTVPRDLTHQALQYVLNCLCSATREGVAIMIFPERGSIPSSKGPYKAFFRTSYVTKWKRNGHMGQPCRTPLEMTKGGRSCP